MSETYDPRILQERWRPVWDELDPFRADDDGSRERRYVVDMFPYPSGDLHMGHAEAFAIGDVVARYWFQLGYDVLHPVGWDSSGLPADGVRGRVPTSLRALRLLAFVYGTPTNLSGAIWTSKLAKSLSAEILKRARKTGRSIESQ
jgi:leucyl-tRNA synthetase